MSESTRVFVLGSCVTRDAFELDASTGMELVGYFARTSLASAFRRKRFVGVDTSTISSAFQRRTVEQDLDKALETTLRQVEFDLLVFDPIDERFNLAQLGDGSIATVSNEFLSATAAPPYETIRSGSEEFLRLWVVGWYRLLATLDSLGARSRLRVNRVFWADGCTGDEEFASSYSRKGIDRANTFLGRLYSIMEQDLEDWQFVRYPPELFVGDPGHKWGASPFHYIDPFYRHFLSELVIEPRTSAGPRHVKDTAWECGAVVSSDRSRGKEPGEAEVSVRDAAHVYLRRHLVYSVHERAESGRIVFVFPGLDSTPGVTSMSHWRLGAELDATVVHLKDHVGAHGCYLLSVSGDNQIRNVVLSLIRELIAQYSVPPEGVYFVGTSKGGTAAIAFGLMHGGGRVIAGGPQIALGAFLYQEPEQLEWQRSVAYAIFGRVDDGDRDAADNLVPSIFERYGPRFRGSMSISYGSDTGYWQAHIEPLTLLVAAQGLSRCVELRQGGYAGREAADNHFLHRVRAELIG
ncbi:hypothetical protein ASE27_02645 [Oerskovia sp. Root918]|uniref:DUF6270 domain-containing protein n=1 Tax=Oerskovia sp. Root918 TaxID=1736607 RepID=UPI0006FC0E20|nr:DUF6270 domain-containing protein [Oerskovia sp. Root918]KRD47287.1 hypothetical protein ASE27_02645 [Oerskovia sp. Root918]